MQKQSLVYFAIIILVVLAFGFGFYLNSSQTQEEKPEIRLKPLPGQLLELNPEFGIDYLIDAIILSINLNTDPAEIIVNVDLTKDRFINPPIDMLRKTILVDEKTIIGIGSAYAMEIDEYINLTDLRVNDHTLISVMESTAELLEREQYTAFGIKVMRESPSRQ